MGLNLRGGIAAAAGFRKGALEEEQRQKDADYQDGQRAHQQAQQQRTEQDWRRQDAAREELSQIDPNQPQDVQLRRAASVARQSGDIKTALELHDKADRVAIDRSTKAVQGILAGAQGKSAMQLVSEAATILNDDPVPGGIENIREDGNGGVTFDVKDAVTGKVMQKSFANQAAVTEWLMAYKAPDVYANMVKLRQAASIKSQENLADPSKRFQRVGNNIFDASNQKFISAPVPPGHEYIGDDPSGNPQYRRIGTSGGTGAGTAGKGGKGEVTGARDILLGILEKTEDKPTQEVRANAETYLENILTAIPNVPPAAAANVAAKVARDPKLLKPTINVNTGEIDGVFRDAVIAGGKPFTIAKNFMSPEQAEQAFPQDKTFMRKQVQELVARQAQGLTKAAPGPDGKEQRVPVSAEEAKAIQEAYVQAAFDPAKRAELLQRVQAAGPDAVASLERKLDLIAKYYPNPSQKTGSGEGPVVRGLAAAARHIDPKYIPPVLDLGIVK